MEIKWLSKCDAIRTTSLSDFCNLLGPLSPGKREEVLANTIVNPFTPADVRLHALAMATDRVLDMVADVAVGLMPFKTLQPSAPTAECMEVLRDYGRSVPELRTANRLHLESVLLRGTEDKALSTYLAYAVRNENGPF